MLIVLLTRVKFIYFDGTSDNMTKDDFDVFRIFICKRTFKMNINHRYFNTLFLKLPVSGCSSFVLIFFSPISALMFFYKVCWYK